MQLPTHTHSPPLRFGLCAIAASVCFATSGEAATQSIEQVFSNSYSNIYTRTVKAPLGGRKTSSKTEDVTLLDTTAPSGTFDYFDAGLGTLKEVEVTFSGTPNANSGSDILSFSCSGVLTGCSSSSVRGAGGIGYFMVLDLPSPETVTGQRRGNLIEFGVGNKRPFLADDPWTETKTYASAFDQFIGTGQFRVIPRFEPQSFVGINCATNAVFGLDKCEARGRTTYGAIYSVSLRYTYDDGTTPPGPNVVPLPAGAPLLLGGLGLLGWMRRRKG